MRTVFFKGLLALNVLRFPAAVVLLGLGRRLVLHLATKRATEAPALIQHSCSCGTQQKDPQRTAW